MNSALVSGSNSSNSTATLIMESTNLSNSLELPLSKLSNVDK